MGTTGTGGTRDGGRADAAQADTAHAGAAHAGASPRTRGTGAVLLAGVVVVLAVLGAALGGPWSANPRPPGEVPTPPQQAREVVSPVDGVPLPEISEGAGGLHPMVLVIAALVVLGAFLLRWFMGRATFARGDATLGHATAPGRQVDAVTPPEVEPDLPALRRGVAAAQAVLASAGDADDVVIAAWLELEKAALSSGVPRAPAQTPTEFTAAVLDATAADPSATRTLLGLYHRARFGTGEAGRMGEEEVATATDCLGRLAGSWAAST